MLSTQNLAYPSTAVMSTQRGQSVMIRQNIVILKLSNYINYHEVWILSVKSLLKQT